MLKTIQAIRTTDGELHETKEDAITHQLIYEFDSQTELNSGEVNVLSLFITTLLKNKKVKEALYNTYFPEKPCLEEDKK